MTKCCATVGRTLPYTRIHLAILRICDTHALDATDRGAVTDRCRTNYLWTPSRSICTIHAVFGVVRAMLWFMYA
jgi:hypothetical protein